jgi:putative addiction module component (TIGR02574 family)
MSVEQIEATIRALPPEERAQFVEWFDDHRSELVADDVSEAQKAELLRRRQEYDEHPERFVHMDAKGIDEMCERINREVKSRLSSAR